MCLSGGHAWSDAKFLGCGIGGEHDTLAAIAADQHQGCLRRKRGDSQ